MANQRRNAPVPIPPAIPVTSITRGPDSGSLDGGRGDANSSRGLSTPQEQGGTTLFGGASGSGEGPETSLIDEGARDLAAPLALPATALQGADGGNPFSTADGVLKTIADRFNAARELGKVGAWRQFQKDLMNASPHLVPVLLPYKDLISIVSEIEKEIKGSNAQVGESNEELLAKFLSGKGKLGADITASVPEGIDIPATITSSERVAS